MSLMFRRNFPLALLLAALLAVLVFVLGDERIIAYTTSPSAANSATLGSDYSSDVMLFDDSRVHEIQVLMSEADYDLMLSTYQSTGLKEYFQVDVVIDDERINNVGIRLKGNASLRTALGGQAGGIAGRGDFIVGFADGQAGLPEGMGDFQPPEGFGGFQGGPPMGDGEVPQGGFQPPRGGGFPQDGMGELPQDEMGGFPQSGMGRGQAISEELIKIPFMVKFDEFVDGQTYQGYTAIAIRNYGTSYDEALLQEPISNLAARLSGLPATETVYTGFRFNGGAEKLYVVSELVNQEYVAKHFKNEDGVLFKAEIGATLSYEGEQPSRYADSFTQQTRVNDADLLPLIRFMRFLDEADDATFDAELANYLDVDAFATYLAVNAILVNNDSMIGMNNNYYLYYDEQTSLMTVMLWDTNESLGKLGGNSTADLSLTSAGRSIGGRGGGGLGGGQNALLSRFTANQRFMALYQHKLQQVYEAAFASGTLLEKIDEYASLINAADAERNLVDEDAYTTAAQQVRTFIQQRLDYLESSEWIEPVQ
ncbi:MAG: CotH kinase family protein [Anaerolineales bacterium]|nr:CotH kinase family protein [Anaerolineales bacterium]